MDLLSPMRLYLIREASEKHATVDKLYALQHGPVNVVLSMSDVSQDCWILIFAHLWFSSAKFGAIQDQIVRIMNLICRGFCRSRRDMTVFRDTLWCLYLLFPRFVA